MALALEVYISSAELPVPVALLQVIRAELFDALRAPAKAFDELSANRVDLRRMLCRSGL